MKHRLTAAIAATWLSCVTGAQAQEASVPSAQRPLAQLQEEFLSWKFGLFLHFNIATFNGQEWANGYEDPLTFAPKSLDCGQWADAAKLPG